MAIIVISIFSSCEPRVDLDLSQWGDQAFITNVQVFTHEIRDDFRLAEFVENGTESTGVRRFLLQGAAIDVNNDNFVVTITAPTGTTDFSASGFLITHTSTLVEPLSGAPKGGIIADLNSGSFQYRLHSADKTTHDWTINIVTN